MSKYLIILLAALNLLASNDAQAQSKRIDALTECRAWPNERLSGNVPLNAIDQSTDTFTWCTELYNTSAAYIAVAFAEPTEVARIRMWKDDDGTGWPTPSAKDLVVFFSKDEGPLEQRSWKRVRGLTGNFKGAEIFRADSVGADGYVWGDAHDSVHESHGWGSLVFDPVLATGVCIHFSNSPGGTLPYVHYKLHEFEAWGLGPEPTQESSWGRIKSLYEP